jgi:hypothetical protein
MNGITKILISALVLVV